MLSIIALLTEFVVLSFLKTVIGDYRSIIFLTILIILFSIALLFEIFNSKTYKKYVVPIVGGYVFRIILLYWDIYLKDVYALPGSGGDSEGFYKTCLSFAAGENITYGVPYTKIMGYIAKIVGYSRLYLQFINILFFIITVLFVIKIFRYINISDKTKWLAIVFLSFLPNYAILSSIFLRESLTVMLVAISLYFFVKWFFNKKTYEIVISFVFVFISAVFHSGLIGMAGGYFIVVLLYDKENSRFKPTLKSIFIALVLFFLFAYIYRNYNEVFFSRFSNVKSITDISSGEGRGGSSYAQYVGNSSSIISMVIFTIPRFVFFMFSPFPWQWRGISDIIAFVFSSMFYLWTWIRTIKYIKYVKNENRKLVIALILVSLCVLFIFAWGVTNTGTAVRHRDKMIALYIILWCTSTSRKQKYLS